MKITNLISIMLIITFMSFSIGEAKAVTIIKLGKGGVVIQPNGSYKLCPQFAFRKCCTITFSLKDVWNWITGDGCWDDDINTHLPWKGNAVVFDDDGSQIGTYDVKINWINPSSCGDISGDEIIVNHPDIQLEVIQ